MNRNKVTGTTMLPIYLYGHPQLREIAQDISADYPDLEKLIADMWDTMYASDGVGLAAPQVGLPIRLLVIDGDPLKKDFPECKDFKRCMINAHFIEETGKQVSYDEGCLSIPFIYESVTRPDTITVQYVDEHFEPHTETLTGYAARIVQHEYDHLEGVLFTDRVSPLRKQLLKKKLHMIEEGRIKPDYAYIAAPPKRKKLH